jgi:hypothetical protein
MDLELARPALQRFSIRQSQAFVAHLERIGGHNNKRLWLTLLAITVLIDVASMAGLAFDRKGDKAFYVALVVASIILSAIIVFRVVSGVNAVGVAIHTLFLYPLLRWNVNRIVGRTLKNAPFTVTYHFAENSYSVHIPEARFKREIRGDEITVAYYSEPLYCLFKNNKQMWKAIIYATADEHRRIVGEFLRRNQIDLRDAE